MDLSLVSPGLLLAVLATISLGGLLKGMTGLGLPIFAVPALAAITSVEDAVVLMIFPGIGANLWLVISHRRYRYLLREHVPFLATGFAGGLLGTWLLQKPQCFEPVRRQQESGLPAGDGRRNNTGCDRHVCPGCSTLLSRPGVGAGTICLRSSVHLSVFFDRTVYCHGKLAIADPRQNSVEPACPGACTFFLPGSASAGREKFHMPCLTRSCWLLSL